MTVISNRYAISIVQALVFSTAAVGYAAGTAVAAEELYLWEAVAPGSEGYTKAEKVEERGTAETGDRWITNISRSTLTVFLPPEGKHGGTGIVVCPGGGYGGLAFDKEGIEIAQWLNELGIAAFVLKYRCGGGPHQHPVPLGDVQRAIRMVRGSAEQWNLQADRIGVMGFSAGGHLASTLATHYDAGDPQAADRIERQSCRPSFSALIYPVISMEAGITHEGSRENLLGESPDSALVRSLSNATQVTVEVGPTFIVHAADDEAVPVENSLQYYTALMRHGVAAELHVFAQGGHGFGMREQEKPIVAWPGLLAAWLKSRGLAE